MARLQSANNAETTIVSSMAPSDTSFVVADASLFPNAPFRVSIDAEIMEIGVIDKLTNTFSNVLRGQESTVAANHLAATPIQNRFTAGTHAELEATADAQTKANNAQTQALQLSKDYVHLFGLGVEPTVIADANVESTPTGFYIVDGTSLNAPAGTAGGSLIHMLRASRPTQIFIDYSDTELWIRSRRATGWSDWTLINPESGINGNGEFVKYADGTMIQFMRKIVDGDGTNFYQRTDVPYPVAFASTPVLSVTGYNNQGGFSQSSVNKSYGTVITNSTYRWGLEFNGNVPSDRQVTANVIAIGRWKV